MAKIDAQIYESEKPNPDLPMTLNFDKRLGSFVLENTETKERRIFNGNINVLLSWIAKKENSFNLDTRHFKDLPHEAVDYQFNFKVVVRAKQGESEEEIFHWIQDQIANIADVIEVNET